MITIVMAIRKLIKVGFIIFNILLTLCFLLIPTKKLFENQEKCTLIIEKSIKIKVIKNSFSLLVDQTNRTFELLINFH